MTTAQPTLVVWWPKAHEQREAREQSLRVRYEVHSLSGKLHGGHEALNALPNHLPCLVLAAPADVGVFAVEPPKLSGKKLHDALPFLVEPFLLNEPEDNHVSLWGKQAAVISKQHARAIVQACQHAKLNLIGISCETLREPLQKKPVAWISEQCLIWVDEHDVPLCIPTHQAQALKVLLAQRLAQHRVHTVCMGQADAAELRTLVGGELAAQLNTTPLDKTHLQNLALLHQKNLLNPAALRRLGVNTEGQGQRARQLGVAVLGLIATAVLGLNAVAFQTKRHAQAIADSIEARYNEVLPNTPMMADPLLLIEREKNQLSTGSAQQSQGVVNTLHAVGLAMQGAPFNSMQGVSWTDRTLRIRFTANLDSKLQDSTVQELQTSGLSAKWVNPDKTGPVLHVQIKERP